MSGGVYGGDETGAIVFDIGSYTLRAGFAGEDAPKTEIPANIGVLTESNSGMDMNGSSGGTVGGGGQPMDIDGQKGSHGSKRTLYIDPLTVMNPRKGMEVENYLKDSMIEDWDAFEEILEYLYKRPLCTDSSLYPVLMSEPAWNTRQKRERVTELLFEKFNVPAFFLAKNAVLAAFANGRSTGLVIDSGATHTSAVPVHDGYVLTQAVVRSPLGGDFVTKQCRLFMEEHKYDLVPPQFIASKNEVKENEAGNWTRKTGIPTDAELSKSWMDHAINNQLLQDFKSTVLQCSDTPYDKETAENMPTIHYEFPHGYHSDWGHERFLIPEGLFDTSFIKFPQGTNPPGTGYMGVAQVATTSVGMADIDVRPSLYGNVIVTGGNTLLNGYTDRLTRDLQYKTPPSMRFKLLASTGTQERRYGAWIGGSILASLGTFQQLWISRQEYDEGGKAQVDRKCP